MTLDLALLLALFDDMVKKLFWIWPIKPVPWFGVCICIFIGPFVRNFAIEDELVMEEWMVAKLLPEGWAFGVWSRKLIPGKVAWLPMKLP